MALCGCGQSATRLVATTGEKANEFRLTCRKCGKAITNTSLPKGSRGHPKNVNVQVTRLPKEI